MTEEQKEEQKTEAPKSDAQATQSAAPKKKQAKKKAAKKAAAKPADKKAGTVYLVTTKQDGFRRAGRSWSGTTQVDADELTEAQLQQLRDDPMFNVQEGVVGN